MPFIQISLIKKVEKPYYYEEDEGDDAVRIRVKVNVSMEAKESEVYT
ncbi:hypothetical protein [Bacillus sp. SA1-12]|nr:hypothetical protein [Bacillus sp. SA1-12]